jgi:tetratricopeptide (TPR) repeat protein
MNTHCTKLHLFMDGELTEVEAEAFRAHLPRCSECEAGLRDLLQLELLATRALGGAAVEAAAEAPREQASGGKVVALRPWLHRAYKVTVPLAAAACMSFFFVQHRAPATVPGVVFLEDAPTRMLEARLSYPAADHHRPYGPMRGTDSTPEALPLRPLAEMFERGELRGVAAAYALRGDWQQAEAFLEKEKPSADRNNDRAVLAMSRHVYPEALSLLDAALREQPRHPQALWNRGLVLREMGQREQAAASFDAVAALNEPGWSDEARAAAALLRGSGASPLAR